jgi:hypothetical protein
MDQKVFGPLSTVLGRECKQKGCPRIGQPVFIRNTTLTCFPLGAMIHFHSHHAAHGHDHGICHHWVSRIWVHAGYFTIFKSCRRRRFSKTAGGINL